jgi:hypothetical protein
MHFVAGNDSFVFFKALEIASLKWNIQEVSMLHLSVSTDIPSREYMWIEGVL